MTNESSAAPPAATDEQPAESSLRGQRALPITLTVLAVLALTAAAILHFTSPAQNSSAAGTPGTGTSATGAPSDAAASPLTPAPSQSAPQPLSKLADPSWVNEMATAAAIPERAMNAYAGGSIDANQKYPGCNLGWNTLAAIGYVESEHGTISGSNIDLNGNASPAIIGIALDGNDVRSIPDTDNGKLDGDTTWDHAVGPMQFIPDTWMQYAQDGNLDGKRDPQNIEDAVASTASYLCLIGGDLSQPDNWIAAVQAYNPSVDYNNKVAAAADEYASAS